MQRPDVAIEFQKRRAVAQRLIKQTVWPVLAFLIGCLSVNFFNSLLPTLIICCCAVVWCFHLQINALNIFRCPACEQVALSKTWRNNDAQIIPTDPAVCPRCLAKLKI